MVNVPARIAPARNANAKGTAKKTIVPANIASVRIAIQPSVLAVNLNLIHFVNQGKDDCLCLSFNSLH